MKHWENSTKEIYTVGIVIAGTAWMHFCICSSYQEAVKMAHDQHVATVGPLLTITRCLVWGKCNEDNCSDGLFHGAEFFISTEAGTANIN